MEHRSCWINIFLLPSKWKIQNGFDHACHMVMKARGPSTPVHEWNAISSFVLDKNMIVTDVLRKPISSIYYVDK